MTENEAKRSRKEEAEYWETHTIDEVEGEEVGLIVKKPLSSVFSIRLDPDDVKQLREIASAKGVGPSTMARMLLLEALRKPSPNLRQEFWGTTKADFIKLPQGEDGPDLVLFSKDTLQQVMDLIIKQSITLSHDQVNLMKGQLSWEDLTQGVGMGANPRTKAVGE